MKKIIMVIALSMVSCAPAFADWDNDSTAFSRAIERQTEELRQEIIDRRTEAFMDKIKSEM